MLLRRSSDYASARSGTRLYVAAIVFVMGYEMVTGQTLNIWQQVWVYIMRSRR